MNERMLELYKQSQVPHIATDPSNNMPYESTVFSADKFAKLIVNECAKIAEEVTASNQKNVYQYSIATSIKIQFGVKE